MKIPSIFPTIFLSLILLLSISAAEVHPELKKLEQRVMSTVSKVKESVVAIELMADGRVAGSGSGVIVSADGYIFTAAHVVENNEFAEAILADGSRHKIKVLGMNMYKDAAVCKFVENRNDWPHSPVGNSDDADVTTWVIAMGHGRGYDESRSAPVRFGRIRAHNPGRFLTTDCPLIGGDSGGPLFDLNGKVIGINSSINGLANFNVHAGVSGFIDDLDRMKKGEVWGRLLPNVLYNPETPLVGVIWPRTNDPRPIVADVVPEGPAAKAGIVSGDLIVSVNAERVTTQKDVMIEIGRKLPGETVEVIIKRNQKLLKTDVTLIARDKVDTSESIDASRIAETEDSPYIRDRDKPRLENQIVEVFKWIAPLGKLKADTYIQLYDRFDISTPRLNATIIDDELALAPLSEFLTLPSSLLAWRPGIDAYPVELVGGYEEHDLAVLRIPGLKATTKVLDNTDRADLGEFLAAVSSTGNSSEVVRIGVVSVEERDLRAILGVGGDLRQTGKGAILSNVARGNAAYRMGLRRGDMITSINGVKIDGYGALAEEISKLKVGDEVTVIYLRNGKENQAKSALGVRKNQSGRINMMDKLGKNNLSENRDSFRTVIQSDILVEPHQCGAPIYNLNGEFIGIAISDSGRNKSYILSAEVIKNALAEEPEKIDQKTVKAEVAQIPTRRFQQPRSTPDMELLRQLQREQMQQMERLLKGENDPSSDILRDMFHEFFGK